MDFWGKRHSFWGFAGLLALCFGSAGLGACGDDKSPKGNGDQDGDLSDVNGGTDGEDQILPPWESLRLDEPVPEGMVLAARATSQAELPKGFKAEGLPGDLVLKNARAAFVIEAARGAGGYRQWGGMLVDAVSIQDGVAKGDLYGEIWFGWNLLVFHPETVEVIEGGKDGVAHVRAKGRAERYPWADSFVRALLMPPPADVALTYDYRLKPDSRVLELEISISNDGDELVEMDWPLMVSNMGDGVRTFSEGSGLGEFSGDSPLTWVGGVGSDLSYAVELGGNDVLTPIFSYVNIDLLQLPPFDLEPGKERSLKVRFIVSDEGTNGFDLLRSKRTRLLKGHLEGWVGKAPQLGDYQAEKPWLVAQNKDETKVLAWAPIFEDGSFELLLPEEDVVIQAFAPSQYPSEKVLVEGDAWKDELHLSLKAPATLEVYVVDENEDFLPVQLTVTRKGDTPSHFAPVHMRVSEDPDFGRAYLGYVTQDGAEIQLPAGTYHLVASRGFSYEIDERDIALQEGGHQRLDLKVTRAVPTEGFSASDFHLHAWWSSDSDVPYVRRLHQAAANDIAIPVLTDHAYVSRPAELLEASQVGQWVAPISGQEVTTFEYGHFNAFPLKADPTAPSWGGVFEHGLEGSELFVAMREQQDDEVLIQINHPRSSVGFFSYFNHVKLDSQTGIAQKPARFTDNWDMVEVFNGSCGDHDGNFQTLEDWFNFNNLGWKKTLTSGSDSHSERDGLAHPRTWVQVEKEAIEADQQAIVDPVRSRQVFVSCGPFVRFQAEDGTGMGGLTEVNEDGEVRFLVEVWAPTWMNVNRIRLIENGLPVDLLELPDPYQGTDEERPALRFQGSFTAMPEKDAWYVLEVEGDEILSAASVFGYEDFPYALTNPIDVDQDLDGTWTAPYVPVDD